MHIVLGVIGLIGAALFLYARLTDAGRAAGEPADGAQRAAGALIRAKFRKKVEGSVIAAIDDPILGAAVMMAAVANAREPIDAATATVIKEELRETTGADPSETYEFAIWAIAQAPDPDNISLRLTRMWNNRLSPVERQQLVDMVTRVAAMKGEPTSVQAGSIKTLTARLDLS